MFLLFAFREGKWEFHKKDSIGRLQSVFSYVLWLFSPPSSKRAQHDFDHSRTRHTVIFAILKVGRNCLPPTTTSMLAKLAPFPMELTKLLVWTDVGGRFATDQPTADFMHAGWSFLLLFLLLDRNGHFGVLHVLLTLAWFLQTRRWMGRRSTFRMGGHGRSNRGHVLAVQSEMSRCFAIPAPHAPCLWVYISETNKFLRIFFLTTGWGWKGRGRSPSRPLLRQVGCSDPSLHDHCPWWADAIGVRGRRRLWTTILQWPPATNCATDDRI